MAHEIDEPYEGFNKNIYTERQNLSPRSSQAKQQFHGTNVILCNGSIVMGRDWPFLFLTFLLFSVPLILFSIFTLPFLLNFLGKWVLVPTIALPLLIFIFAFKTGMSDPGIIPRYSAPRDKITLIHNEQKREVLIFHELNPNHILAKEVINVQIDKPESEWPRISLKYCNTCQIFRPPHTSHCSRCDNCVEGFDHHCLWLANCVGKRNYRSFLLFTISLLFTSAVFSLFESIFLVKSWSTSSIISRVIAIAVLFYTIIFDILISLLIFYHLSIIIRGLTTAEHVKMINSGDPLLSNKVNKCADNLVTAFCGPKPKKQVDWSQYQTRKGWV